MGEIRREDKILKPGAWVFEPEACINGALPGKLATAFYDIFHDIYGALYTPLVYCGEQKVNGTNHAIICKINSVTRHPYTEVALVVLHEDFPVPGAIAGEFTVAWKTSIVNDGGYGGYFLRPFPHIPGKNDKIDQIFEKIGIIGASYTPYAYLGSQVAKESLNEMFICAFELSDGSKTISHIDAVVVKNENEEYTLETVIELL